MLIERQVIATWYTPAEKLPPKEWDSCLLTISGEVGRTKFDHVFAIGGYDPDEGWYLDGELQEDIKDFTVHAWCDIDPYKG